MHIPSMFSPERLPARPGMWWCSHCGNVNRPFMHDSCSSCDRPRTPLAELQYNTITKMPYITRFDKSYYNDTSLKLWLRNTKPKYGWFCHHCQDKPLVSTFACPECHTHLDDQIECVRRKVIRTPWDMPTIFENSIRTERARRIRGVLHNIIPRQKHAGYIVLSWYASMERQQKS